MSLFSIIVINSLHIFYILFIFTLYILLTLVYYNINLNLKHIISIEGKSNFNDIFKRVRDGVSLIRLVLMKNIPELLTEQLRLIAMRSICLMTLSWWQPHFTATMDLLEKSL